MVQNLSNTTRRTYHISIKSCFECGGMVWFINTQDNIIYRINFNMRKIEPVCIIPQKNGDQYEHIVIYRDKIFLNPSNGDKICIYDMSLETWRYLEYRKGVKMIRGSAFERTVIKDNLLYLIPCVADYIVCVDMEKEQVNFVGERLHHNVQADSFAYAFGGVWKDSDYIYFTALTASFIYKFHLMTGRYETYDCNSLKCGGSGIIGDDKGVWIVPLVADKILYWDREKGLFNEYAEFPEGYEPGKWSFSEICQTAEYVILLPREANMCILINKSDGKMKNIDLDGTCNTTDRFCAGIYKPISYLGEFGNRILLFNNIMNEFCIYDKKSKIVVGESFDISVNKSLLNILSKGESVYREGMINLNMLIASLCQTT